MVVSVKQVWIPNSSDFNGQSMLLLVDYACLKATQLEEYLKQVNTTSVMIPSHY